MSAFSILLVGHLIADFPFQTPTILRWKFRGGFWIVPHVIIHVTGASVPEVTFGNVPVILVLAVISGVFMFLNVIKCQLACGPIPNIVPKYAFHISKVTGWAAVIGLLVSVFLLR
jgi:hypothetical protein